eukprot:Amastigsp_a676516_190.p4 type:complete len:149 gc:universal Amastigsp_a676516_190:304-750(+)
MRACKTTPTPSFSPSAAHSSSRFRTGSRISRLWFRCRTRCHRTPKSPRASSMRTRSFSRRSAPPCVTSWRRPRTPTLFSPAIRLVLRSLFWPPWTSSTSSTSPPRPSLTLAAPALATSTFSTTQSRCCPATSSPVWSGLTTSSRIFPR